MTDEPKPKPFRVETTVDGDRDAVWRMMTEPQLVREWFGWDYEGLEGEIRYIFVEHVDKSPPARMTFEDGSYIELEDRGPRTVVRAVLPGPLDDADWDDVYDGMEEGWRAFFEQLRFLLDSRPDGRRRTIYLSGVATGADVLAVGGAGETRHESRYLRMTVDSRGHLITAATQAPLDTADPSPVTVTVSTYGLDDAAFQRLRSEWAARWTSVVTDAEVIPAAG